MFPAEALAHTLVARGHTVWLATDARGARFAGQFPVAGTLMLDAATISVRRPWTVPGGMVKILRGVRQAAACFRAQNVRAVVGFGGYPTVPSLLAARALNIPTVIHDQNAIPGRVNRVFAHLATTVACGFAPHGGGAFARRAIVTGNPARPGFADLPPYQPPADRIEVLVTGGSQGARLLSEVVPHALASLPDGLRQRLRVSQQARPEFVGQAQATFEAARIAAEVVPFFADMQQRLARAHLVIGRAGASTVTELAVTGRPSILVPFAAAADDHQTANARTLVDAGGAVMVAERDLSADRLGVTLASLLADPGRLSIMATAAKAQGWPDAADGLADLVLGLLAS